MANELENALKSAATNAAKYVDDASSMTVETKYVEIGGQGFDGYDKAMPVARTVIKLDGDSEIVIPVRKNEAGALEVDTSLMDVHQQNVNTTIEYRARILHSLLSNLLSRTGLGGG